MSGHDVVVVGSINHDLGIGLDRTPRSGETVLGDDARWSPGGKGANQAVGCARLGLDVAMVGAVGDDPAGAAMMSALADEDVDVAHVECLPAPTGLAVVLVDRAGESTIVVAPGANAQVTPDLVDRAAGPIRSARVVLCQLEVPVAAIERATTHATGLVVLNPAPGRRLPAALLRAVDVLVPNRHELALLVGAETATSRAAVEAQARRLDGPGAVVVTLGAEGALVVEPDATTFVAAIPITAVDTTGAGDAFCAGLVAGLLAGDGLVTAARGAARIGAATATMRGAMDALPSADEVEDRLRS